MGVPTNVLLQALKLGLASGDISPAAVRELLPKERTQRVPKSLHEEAKRLTVVHHLDRDNLRFAVSRSSGGQYSLNLVNGETGRFAGPKLGAKFDHSDGMDGAADVVLANYLSHISQAVA